MQSSSGKQRHYPGQHSRNDSHADGPGAPLPALIRGGDIGLEILRSGDCPCLCAADPEVIHAEPVYQIHYGQYHQQLNKAGQKSPRAVDGVYAHEHVGNISGNAAQLEELGLEVEPQAEEETTEE